MPRPIVADPPSDGAHWREDRLRIFLALLGGRRKRNLCDLADRKLRGYYIALWRLAAIALEEEDHR